MQHGGSKTRIAPACSRGARLFAVLAMGASLAACASISEKIAVTAADAPLVGMPAGVPERPAATTYVYPAVHDMPPQRSTTLLNAVEQQKMEDDLVALRERQHPGQGVPAKPAAEKKQPARQAPRIIPVASSSTIY